MRKIRFRGFHADDKEKAVIKLNGKEIRGKWLYGDLHTDGPYINEHKVISETVGQFTGMTDNVEKEIYEGDILISNKSFPLIRRYLIVYNCKFAGFVGLTQEGHYLAFYNDSKDYTKSGNIFENPELLEV